MFFEATGKRWKTELTRTDGRDARIFLISQSSGRFVVDARLRMNLNFSFLRGPCFHLIKIHGVGVSVQPVRILQAHNRVPGTLWKLSTPSSYQLLLLFYFVLWYFSCWPMRVTIGSWEIATNFTEEVLPRAKTSQFEIRSFLSAFKYAASAVHLSGCAFTSILHSPDSRTLLATFPGSHGNFLLRYCGRGRCTGRILVVAVLWCSPPLPWPFHRRPGGNFSSSKAARALSQGA